jgi:hypothetical protein
VTWTVRNDGAGEARGSWTDRVFLRKAGQEGPGTQVGSYTYQGRSAPGSATLARRRSASLPTPAIASK